MRRLRIAVTILGLAATLWLRDLHYYYLDSIGLPPPVSGIKLVDLEAITRTLVNTASALLALAYVVSPAHSLAAGMLWAAADAILWLDPKLPVYTAAVVLTVYALWNLLGQTRGGEKFLPALLEIMPIATVIAVIGLLYILLDRLPGMLIAQRILQGDVALLAATLGSTAAWDFAAAIASLFLVGLWPPAFLLIS
ncbi:hypothetical protein [Aeropyrum camini]|uniref:hypothetical protein n=1 Tax=Aeropyrum camini TaxID=229980 RepID=UPI000788B0E6|nr:hypothetical protein [Aeropyrum camini]